MDSRAHLERVLADHGASLRRIARVYAKDAADAADLAQDIALALFRALPSFRGESSERTFVFRVAHNRGISHAMARRTREDVTPPPLVSGAPREEAADPKPTPEEALDAARRAEALLGAVAALPVGSRAVITLALEGMSHAEIADVLGTSTNSVAVRLSRARAELRTRLEKDR
jgi:RNA polymerase sigma factor (sigma-70 family)